MTLENFSRGTKPKVEGSLHLSELFQDDTLDFFVFMSSVVSVIGRPGQTNYSAANAFMTGLAQQRRQKGLAASVLHIGAIYGIGFAASLKEPIYSRAAFRSTALVPTCERDFYQLFAEGIIAGRPGSLCDSIEILSGVKRVSKLDEYRPVWESEPLMSHFIRDSDDRQSSATDNSSRVPLKTRLLQVHDHEEVFTIIQDAFLRKICSLLQLNSNKTSKDTLVAIRLDEMGIDSLLAAEIRGWFSKTLETNVPILKSLSGLSIKDLVKVAVQQLPKRLLSDTILDLDSEDADRSVEAPVALSQSSQDTETANNSGLSAFDTSEASQISSSASETTLHGDTSVSPPQKFSKLVELSFTQETFWFVWLALKDKSSLNHTALARITGRIRVPDFERAVRSLVRKHEILRTCIIERNDKPMQAIMREGALQLEIAQIDNEESAFRAVQQLQDHHVYDVAQGQMIRCMLLSISPDDHYFFAGLHPLVADGMSFQILLKSIQQLYVGTNHEIAADSHQFSHHAEQQRVDYASGKFSREIQFWKTELSTIPQPLPILTLSKQSSRPDLEKYENLSMSFEQSILLKTKIQAICQRLRVTPFHFYLATFRALLFRFSPINEGEDVAIGIGDANRTEDSMMEIIGPLMNQLTLRLRASSSTSFTQLIQQAREKAYAAIAHSRVPFHIVLDE